MQGSHTARAVSASFDDPNLVSAAGLVPAMRLAAKTGLGVLVDRWLRLCAVLWPPSRTGQPASVLSARDSHHRAIAGPGMSERGAELDAHAVRGLFQELSDAKAERIAADQVKAAAEARAAKLARFSSASTNRRRIGPEHDFGASLWSRTCTTNSSDVCSPPYT